MTDLDDVDIAIDNRARTAAAGLHRAASRRVVESARSTPPKQRYSPGVLAVAVAAALVLSLMVIRWQRRDDVASQPLDPSVYVIDGWDIAAADLPADDAWPSGPSWPVPSLRATYLATPDVANGPVAVVYASSFMFLRPDGPVTEGRAGGYEVVLSEGESGLRRGQIRTDRTGADGGFVTIEVQTIGLTEQELLAVVESLSLADDLTPTVDPATLPAELAPVATDDWYSSQVPLVTGMENSSLAEHSTALDPFRLVEQTDGDRRIRVATMPFAPARWIHALINARRTIGDVMDVELEASVLWKAGDSIVVAGSTDLTVEELAAMTSSARPMTNGEVPEQAIGIAGVTGLPSSDAPSATEAPAVTEVAIEAETVATDPPAVAPDTSQIVDVAVSFAVEERSRNEVRLTGALADGQQFGIDVAVVFDRITARDLGTNNEYGGMNEGRWGDDYLFRSQAGDMASDDWLDVRVASTDRADAAVFEALSADGRRYRTDLISVPARPDVKFGVIAMKHGTWVSARLVDADGNTLVAYDSNGTAV